MKKQQQQQNKENRNHNDVSKRIREHNDVNSVLLLHIPLHVRSRLILLLIFRFSLSYWLQFIHFFEGPCVNRTHMRRR